MEFRSFFAKSEFGVRGIKSLVSPKILIEDWVLLCMYLVTWRLITWLYSAQIRHIWTHSLSLVGRIICRNYLGKCQTFPNLLCVGSFAGAGAHKLIKGRESLNLAASKEPLIGTANSTNFQNQMDTDPRSCTCERNLCNCEKKPEKYSGLQRGMNPWPRDTGAVLLPTDYEATEIAGNLVPKA